MDNGFHSTYNDYLIYKTKQNKSLRNQIIDPNVNIRRNLPLYINYQVSALRKERSAENMDYNSIHNKITQKIEKINELSLVNEKTQNLNKNYDNFLPKSSRKKLVSLSHLLKQLSKASTIKFTRKMKELTKLINISLSKPQPVFLKKQKRKRKSALIKI